MVSFSLKMIACQLLTEITYLLRDPPVCFNPYIPSCNSPYSTTQNTPRPSNVMPPTDYPSESDDLLGRSLDQPRSSAGSLDPGLIQSRSNSLDVPRNLLIPSDQGSDTSGGEEMHKKPLSLDIPVMPEIAPSPITPTFRLPISLPIPPATTPEVVPSIVIASPTAQKQQSMVRRGSLPQAHAKLRPQGGSFDKQTTSSPTSYLHRKLSTFKDSFRKVRSVALKGGRRNATAKTPSTVHNRKSSSTPMSHAGSHKSLCDDPLCNNLPWINVVVKLYQCDLQESSLLASYKTSCAELEGALRRLYTLPPSPTTTATTVASDNTDSIRSDSTFQQSYTFCRREKGCSISSSCSTNSSGTFSLNRFSRGSINLTFLSRRLSQLTTHRETTVTQENRVTTSPNKCLPYDEELFGDNIEGALERHAMMLQSRRIKNNDDKKINYLNKEVKGLLHAPFTVLQLAMAANLVDATKIADIRDICWYLLLDTNQELVQSAGELFYHIM